MVFCYQNCSDLLWKKNCSNDREKSVEIWGWRPRIFKIFEMTKGQLISKWFLESSISSKKRTNEFIFTTMRRDFVRFLEEIEDTKNAFRN